MRANCDWAVIGGGFFGLYLAEFLARRGGRVLLLERGPELMRRASYVNQARVHNGYHYPRSVLTALRSRVNFPRFVAEFRPAIDTSFEKIYAIARRWSKVTAEQFYGSMTRIGAPIRPAAKAVRALFNSDFIEAAFTTVEHAFDAVRLRDIMAERVRAAGVEVRLNAEVRGVQALPGGAVRLDVNGTPLEAGGVFCCTYSQLNVPGAAAGLPLVPLKHELAEMCLVQPPPELKHLGITVMDGPFFSLMPFPPRGLHTLSHVRYTPHARWQDGGPTAYEVFERTERRTAFAHMVRDAARYLPAAARCEYRDSLWDVKTVLPQSETDDSRPILFRPHHGLRNYHLVMGGKIDNVYDVAEVIGRMLDERGE